MNFRNRWYDNDRNPYVGFTGAGEKSSNVIRRGTEQPNSKLNPDKVREIRAKLASGATQAALAREYGIAATTIGKIGSKKLWRDVV